MRNLVVCLPVQELQFCDCLLIEPSLIGLLHLVIERQIMDQHRLECRCQ